MLALDEHRIMLQYRIPLNEIVVDFHDTLKSLSSGYASFDYEDDDYEKTEIVKLDILLNGKSVDALATIVHKEKAYEVGKSIVVKLKEVIRP
jgi:translation elongation factor EF-4